MKKYSHHIKLVLILFFTFFYAGDVAKTYGQSACTAVSNAGNDTVICSPAVIRLHGSTTAPAANIRSIIWQPAAGLSSYTVLNPTASITHSVTYHLNVIAVSDTNTIVNGDFSNGATGFTTAYIPGTGGTYGLLSNEGEYDINTDPSLDHVNFVSFGDHTTGTGNMLIVNGASVANTAVWCETINVLPGVLYSFSAWVASCVISNPALLQFSINGNLLGSTFAAPTTAGTWVQFFQNWNSGSNTTANICIVNQNIGVGGNDFALDDISFSQACNLTDSVVVTLASPGSLNLGNDTVVCPGQSLALNSFSSSNTTHLWNTGSTASSITVTTQGQYSVTSTVGGTCSVADTIVVRFVPVNVNIDSASVSLGEGDSVLLSSSVIDSAGGAPYSYAWTPSQLIGCATCPATSVAANPDAVNTYYYLTVTDNIGCSGRDSVLIIYVGCDAHVIIPNVFTPNGDNFNDMFSVNSQCPDNFRFIIFNRWGILVYETGDPGFHWNGKTKGGSDASAGTYFYECTMGHQKLHGSIELIRK